MTAHLKLWQSNDCRQIFFCHKSDAAKFVNLALLFSINCLAHCWDWAGLDWFYFCLWMSILRDWVDEWGQKRDILEHWGRRKTCCVMLVTAGIFYFTNVTRVVTWHRMAVKHNPISFLDCAKQYLEAKSPTVRWKPLNITLWNWPLFSCSYLYQIIQQQYHL